MKVVKKAIIQVSCLASKLLTNMLYKYVLVKEARYLVVVEWWFNDSVVQHKAWNMQDALEWMQCYPNDCCVLVRETKKRKDSNYGAIVASRGY